MSANRSNDVAKHLKLGAEKPDGGARPNSAPCRVSTLNGPVPADGLVPGPLDRTARSDDQAHEATHIAERPPQVEAVIKDRARYPAHQS